VQYWRRPAQRHAKLAVAAAIDRELVGAIQRRISFRGARVVDHQRAEASKAESIGNVRNSSGRPEQKSTFHVRYLRQARPFFDCSDYADFDERAAEAPRASFDLYAPLPSNCTPHRLATHISMVLP
jgi:hypothetical protein